MQLWTSELVCFIDQCQGCCWLCTFPLFQPPEGEVLSFSGSAFWDSCCIGWIQIGKKVLRILKKLYQNETSHKDTESEVWFPIKLSCLRYGCSWLQHLCYSCSWIFSKHCLSICCSCSNSSHSCLFQSRWCILKALWHCQDLLVMTASCRPVLIFWS